MTIAYLIFAHTDPEALSCLVSAVVAHDANAHALIHVDAKEDISPFIAVCSGLPRTRFLEKRVRVSWSAYSFLFAQVESLRNALNAEECRFDRFVLLSGLDYPIVRPDRIARFFAGHREVEFLGGGDLSASKMDSAHWRINHYHLFRDVGLPSFVKRAVMKLSRDSLWCFGFRKSIQAPFGRKQVNVYTGGDWLSITRGFADFVLHVFDNDREFRTYFRSSFCPSEMFYHTILYNSRYCEGSKAFGWSNAHVADLPSLTPLHYLRYGKAIVHLDEHDHEEIIRSGKLFARKLVTGKSDRLRELILNDWLS